MNKKIIIVVGVIAAAAAAAAWLLYFRFLRAEVQNSEMVSHRKI